MADKTDFTPELTLTPNLDAAAAAEAPQAPEAPALTLDPTGAVDAAAAQKAKDEQAIQLDESKLTEAERKMVDDFAKQIDLTDSNVVLQYGAAAQKNIAGFSESTLNSVRTKDLGEIGQALSSLVVELKGFGKEEDEKGIFGFFKKKKNELEAMKVAYTKAEANVDKIAEVLEGHQVTLMKDIAMLDQMYELNTKYYKELTMYILAGKKRLNQVRANELEQLRQKAAQSGTQEDAQAYNDLTNMCSRFEKKLHDLELTRMISIQMGPQTRLIQNNDTLMLEKIQSSLVNTIPLWKSQMVLSLGLEHSRPPVSKGIEIIEGLRGHTSGFCVPTFVVDAPGGGGKTPVMPQYIISQTPKKVILRNYEGVITTYTEPEHYTDCQCDYCTGKKKKELMGVAGLERGQALSMEPANLERHKRSHHEE